MLHLQQHFVGKRPRQAGAGAVGARRADLVVAAVDCYLAGPAFPPQHAQLEDQLPLADVAEPLRYLLRRIEMLAHLDFERGSTQCEGVLQSLFDFDVEPGIDASIDELH